MFIHVVLRFAFVPMLEHRNVSIVRLRIDIKHLNFLIPFEILVDRLNRRNLLNSSIHLEMNFHSMNLLLLLLLLTLIEMNDPMRLYSMWLERRENEGKNCSNGDVIENQSIDHNEQHRNGQRHEIINERFFEQQNQNTMEIVDLNIQSSAMKTFVLSGREKKWNKLNFVGKMLSSERIFWI